jgi:UDP-3-O-[3-hydroxymyristoyl] glucosamine N-acyltransferase
MGNAAVSRPVAASAIAQFLELPLKGADLEVWTVCPANAPVAQAVTFASRFSEPLLAQLNTLPVFVIATPDYEGKLHGPYVLTPRPRLMFARVLTQFFTPPREPTIATTAMIAGTAVLGPGVSVGHFSVIGEGAKIGAGTEIRDHVVIRAGCTIGERCLIKSHSVIGEEGFGFEFEEDGTPVRIPHLGTVTIGDEVEIGAMTVIARGTLTATAIAHRVKIDDHVFIAHNVRIGENTVVIAGAEVSGSVQVGKNVWIAPQACVIDQAQIGDGALVGIGAVVTKSVDAGVIVVGNPARVIRKRD